jgi:hypothetical protein
MQWTCGPSIVTATRPCRASFRHCPVDHAGRMRRSPSLYSEPPCTLLPKHSPPMLLAHFVGDAFSRQPKMRKLPQYQPAYAEPPKADIGDLTRLLRCGAVSMIIPANMRRAAMRFLQSDVQRHQCGRDGRRRVQSVGREWDFYGTVFRHAASNVNRLMPSRIFPSSG